MKRIVILLAFACLGLVPLCAQTVAMKTNLLSDALLTPSLGAEVMLDDCWSLSLTGGYMPMRLSHDHYWRTFTVQPEVRYWLADRMSGLFIGAAYQYRGFNLGGLPFSHLKDSRSQGRMQGGGVSVGYHYILSTRWSLEPSVTVGWSHLHWSHYGSARSDLVKSKWTADYVGPLDVGLCLVYILR